MRGRGRIALPGGTVRANGDTFHVTNCSPQRGNYNRSNLGGIWGGLENFIGAQADTEQFCIFAGPVLADGDLRFGGTPVQIPTRFWKVVCAVKAKKLQVFAFMLEHRPGCYLFLGNGDGEGSCMVHNPGYDFNDAAMETGAAFWSLLTERFLR